MRSTNPSRGWSAYQGGLRQRGQALVYGLFVLAGGLAALFFLFNAGQLAFEKDKLTTTADAVAYSGGVMRARALNFTAYTNRALVANEVAVAQMVSVASWTHYIASQGTLAASLGCESWWNWPAANQFAHYAPLCMGLYYSASYTASISNWLDVGAPALIAAIEVAKTALSASQVIMLADLEAQSHSLLTDIARANYRDPDTSAIKVDSLFSLPFDDFFSFEGIIGNSILWPRAGSERSRIANVAINAANRDAFVPNRSWTDKQTIGHLCVTSWKRDELNRSGGTSLASLDEWRGNDTFSYTYYYVGTRKVGWFRVPVCRSRSSTLAQGHQSAGGFSSDRWTAYKGMPRFLDLTNSALSYTPENAIADKRDLRLKFSARVTRDISQTATSEGKSNIKPAADGGTYGLNQYKAHAAHKELAAVSTAEVYFERPVPRADGRKELANVFNPYWQVHLVETPNKVMTAARTLQGVPF